MASTTPAFGWNGSRYYDIENGRFVSASEVRNALESVIDASAIRMNILTEQLQGGIISLADWQTGMMQNIKLAHTAAGAAANGGWANASQSTWGTIGRDIRDQYDYLRNFAAQIADGTQPLDGRLLVRADLYGDAARGTFEDIRYRAMLVQGYEEERYTLEPGADHCDGCLDRADEGWQPIGTLEPLGSQECQVRDMCTVEYRRQNESGEWEESE